MSPRPIKQPRRIDPSLVEIGDDISVEHKEDRGITTTLRGIVAKRVESGSTRYYLTKEGATLMAWQPGKSNKFKITLFARDDVPQSSLFDLPDELTERLAG